MHSSAIEPNSTLSDGMLSTYIFKPKSAILASTYISFYLTYQTVNTNTALAVNRAVVYIYWEITRLGPGYFYLGISIGYILFILYNIEAFLNCVIVTARQPTVLGSQIPHRSAAHNISRIQFRIVATIDLSKNSLEYGASVFILQDQVALGYIVIGVALQHTIFASQIHYCPTTHNNFGILFKYVYHYCKLANILVITSTAIGTLHAHQDPFSIYGWARS